jgi:hypothetical protein
VVVSYTSTTEGRFKWVSSLFLKRNRCGLSLPLPLNHRRYNMDDETLYGWFALLVAIAFVIAMLWN